MQIFVRLETGKVIAIEVSPMDTIDNIKMKIRDKEALSPESYTLQHKGMQVEEGRTLNDYDIRNETTLYLTTNVQRPDFTEGLHSTSKSGKEAGTMELLQYVLYALLISTAIAFLFLWMMPNYATYGLCLVLVFLGVAIFFLTKAMMGNKAASLLR